MLFRLTLYLYQTGTGHHRTFHDKKRNSTRFCGR